MSVSSKMKSWLRRSSLARQRKRRRGVLLFGERRLAGFETLEPRQLLAADFVFDAVLESREGFDLKLSSDGVAIQLRDALTGAVVKTQLIAENSGEIVVTGSSASETLRIDDSVREFSVLFDAGAGIDSLKGPASNAVWNIEAIGSGQLDDFVQFVGVENLIGGPGIDVFTFGDGASITGTLDGGLGSNALDYSAYESPVTVNLAAQTATGTGGVRNVTGVVGGAGSDTLIGSASDAVWQISGADSGSIEDVVEFSGIENLTGSDAGSDFFIIEGEGSISGTLSGGAGGVDGIIVYAEDGSYSRLNPKSTAGSHTATLHGKAITYAGLESVLAGNPTSLVIHGSPLRDMWTLADDPAVAGQIVLTSNAGKFYDDAAATPGLVAELKATRPATGSIRVDLGADADVLLVGSISTTGVSLTVDGGGGKDELLARDGGRSSRRMASRLRSRFRVTARGSRCIATRSTPSRQRHRWLPVRAVWEERPSVAPGRLRKMSCSRRCGRLPTRAAWAPWRESSGTSTSMPGASRPSTRWCLPRRQRLRQVVWAALGLRSASPMPAIRLAATSRPTSPTRASAPPASSRSMRSGSRQSTRWSSPVRRRSPPPGRSAFPPAAPAPAASTRSA